ncbi:MAG TPA: ABC transporter substrate-binding protein [Verrucomicrobiae bacterium]|jgi:polar amino acid transport system substrate-binding protein|nr:ABC transporter substrate-binding protein [Verrucomicrobiae bacterium]
MSISPALRSDLAPTGQIRVGINYANPVLARKDPKTGELSGVAVDLSRELSHRTALPLDLVPYDSAGKMVDGLKNREWDIAFLAVDPGRENEIDFTAPYVEIEGTYLIPAGSPINTIADVDRAGVRVALSKGAAYELFLSRSLRRAEMVKAATPPEALGFLLDGKADVLAGVKQTLIANAEKLPGSRVLDGRFMAIGQAVGISKGRSYGWKYLSEFIEDAKASGLVRKVIEKNGVRGVAIAPKG